MQQHLLLPFFLSFPLSLLIGLVVGSFLNVLISRLPLILQQEWRNQSLEYLSLPRKREDFNRFNLLYPRSHCKNCKKNVNWYDNIPLFSFIWLRGKCRFCQLSINKQYPFVEFLTAVMTAYIFNRFGWNFLALGVCLYTWILISLAIIDYNTQLLPDELTLSLLWLGLFFSVFQILIVPENAILGAMLGYCFFWIIAFIFKQVRKKPGMGHGDFKLLAAIGAWVGPLPLVYVILLASIVNLVANLILLILKKIHYNQAIPFGPALCLAGWIVIMFGSKILEANSFLKFFL